MFLDNDCSLKIKCGVYPLPTADFEGEGPSIDIPKKNMIISSTTEHPESELWTEISANTKHEN